MQRGSRQQALAGALALAMLPAGAAVAQSASGHCEPAEYGDQLAVARVSKAQSKVNFISGVHDNKACPGVTDACRMRQFLMAGDVVMTGRTHEGFVCATYVNAKGVETSGWLPAKALETLAPQPITSADWLGTWRRIEATIRIKPAGPGAIDVDGEAAWGSHDPERVKRGSVRSGVLTGKVKPDGDKLFMSDEAATSFEAVKDGCAVRMRRLARYLLVEDNSQCGGINVTFSGLYVRR